MTVERIMALGDACRELIKGSSLIKIWDYLPNKKYAACKEKACKNGKMYESLNKYK